MRHPGPCRPIAPRCHHPGLCQKPSRTPWAVPALWVPTGCSVLIAIPAAGRGSLAPLYLLLTVPSPGLPSTRPRQKRFWGCAAVPGPNPALELRPSLVISDTGKALVGCPSRSSTHTGVGPSVPNAQVWGMAMPSHPGRPRGSAPLGIFILPSAAPAVLSTQLGSGRLALKSLHFTAAAASWALGVGLGLGLGAQWVHPAAGCQPHSGRRVLCAVSCRHWAGVWGRLAVLGKGGWMCGVLGLHPSLSTQDPQRMSLELWLCHVGAPGTAERVGQSPERCGCAKL